MEQSQTVQEQKKRLDQLLEVKAKVEKKLNTVSSDLQSQETKSREDQQQLGALRQSLDQLSDREREVREASVWITPAKTRPTLPSIGLSVLVSNQRVPYTSCLYLLLPVFCAHLLFPSYLVTLI